jgi:recombinational DNA repair protein RecR
MEQNKFITKLQELANICKVKPPAHGNMRSASKDNEIFRNGKIITIKKNDNSTLNWAIKDVKHTAKSCEDCGRQVVNRRIWRRICYSPDRHWRTTCSICKLTQHPESGKYVVPNNIVVTVFRRWLDTKDK